MTWEEFVAAAEREVAKRTDAGEKYDLAGGIIRALHDRIAALEAKATVQAEDDAPVDPHPVDPQQF